MNKKNYLALSLLAIAILSTWAVYGGNQKNSSPKQTWEYKTLMLSRDGYSGDGSWESIREDANLKKIEPSFTTFQKLKELGDQGWELVSTVSFSTARHDGWEGYNNEGVLLKTTPSYAGYTTNLNYYFKRLK